MRRHHYTNITPTIENELIFYCDCNNNVIDKVSNIDLFATVQGSSSSWNPLYVTDPSDSTRYCLKKRSGAYRVPCVIGDYRGATGNYYKRYYVIAKSQAYSDESATRFLASPTYGDHKVEFYWYCGNSNSVTGSIFDYSGLGNNNANANNSGIALITVGTNVLFRAKNNSATSLDTIVGTRSSLKNKWYFVEMLFEYVSTTQYKVTFSVKDETKSTTIVSGYHILTQPLLNTKVERGIFLFLSDNAGSGNWAINEIDYIKEVKVWRINTPLTNFLKAHNCIFYSPLSQNDTSDWVSGNAMTLYSSNSAVWDSANNILKFQKVSGQPMNNSQYYARWNLKETLVQSVMQWTAVAEMLAYDQSDTNLCYDTFPTPWGTSMFGTQGHITQSAQLLYTYDSTSWQYQYRDGIMVGSNNYGRIYNMFNGCTGIRIGCPTNATTAKTYGMRNFAIFAKQLTPAEITEYFNLI